jgi:16S rRNA (guanine966-N2)-methyltransferase
MTRIVAGDAGGRRLVVPKGDATRPTSERVREAIFGALDARGRLAGSAVLDLFAGSGALGLEAASRGAASVVLVDASRQAVEAARQNVAALGFARVTVVLSSVQRYLASPSTHPADVVFADPPYATGEDEVRAMLAALLESGRLAPGAVVVVERGSRSLEPQWPSGLVRRWVRHYGDTAVWQAEFVPARQSPALITLDTAGIPVGGRHGGFGE